MNLPPQTAARRLVSNLVTPPFVVAVAMLGVAAGLAGPVANWMHIKQGKKALPLKSPLTALNETEIAPYRVKTRRVLDPAVVEALGTDLYLDWTLEDGDLPPNDPLREVNLFVTYYSGGHNLVPHTPDVCYFGAGYAAAMPHENTRIEVATLGPDLSTVPIRVCTFARTAIFDHGNLSVVYMFHCNGRFVATRTGVRVLINDPVSTYAYFSKVEVGFPNATHPIN